MPSGFAEQQIAIDGRELRHGARTGIGRYLLEVLRVASHEGRRCCLYVLPGTPEEELRLPGVTLRTLEEAWTPWWDQVTLPAALARDQAAVCLSPYYKGPLRAPCPVVLTIHDLLFIGYPGRRRPLADTVRLALARLYAAHAAGILTDSIYSQRTITTRLRIEPDRVRVAPLALGREFRPRECPDEVRHRYDIAQPYVFYVGNFLPHKNVPRLLEAYARLPSALRAQYQLVLGGGMTAGRRQLEQAVTELGLDGRVVFTGWIRSDDLPALYSGCSLFVFPSLEEGFGLPVLEAMGCGAPVVASDRASIPEVAGDAALLVDPTDLVALARGLERVLSSPALREDLITRGVKRATEFAPSRTAARVLSYLDEVIKGQA